MEKVTPQEAYKDIGKLTHDELVVLWDALITWQNMLDTPRGSTVEPWTWHSWPSLRTPRKYLAVLKTVMGKVDHA